MVSGKVRYTSREDKLLTLPVPMEASTNKGAQRLSTTCLTVGMLQQMRLKSGLLGRRN